MKPIATIIVFAVLAMPLRADEPKPRAEFSLGDRQAYSLQFSPDGKRLAIEAARYTEPSTIGTVFAVLQLLGGPSPIAPPPAGYRDFRLTVRDLTSREVVVELEHYFGPSSTAFSADWKTLVVNRAVFDLAGARAVKKFDLLGDFDDRFQVYSMSATGSHLAARGPDRDPKIVFRIWELRAPKKEPVKFEADENPLDLGTGTDGQLFGPTDFALSPDGTLLAITTGEIGMRLFGDKTPLRPGIIRFRDAAAGKELMVVDKGEFWPLRPVFSADGKMLKYRTLPHAKDAKPDQTPKTKEWTFDLDKRGRPTERVIEPIDFFEPRVEAGGLRLEVEKTTDDVQLRIVATGKSLASFRPHPKKGTHRSLAVSPDGKTIATGTDTTVRVWNVADVIEAAKEREKR